MSEDLRKNPYYDRPCRLCGAPLGWGQTASGKRVALDLSAPVYAVVGGNKPMEIVRTMMAYPDHVFTCPKVPPAKRKGDTPI